jgi:hypothetical protein
MLVRHVRVVGIFTPEGVQYGCVWAPLPAQPTVFFFHFDLRQALMFCGMPTVDIEARFAASRIY